ncbi:hypothetical protein V5O48_009571 [Marasmius crinis-equi]|uniref:TEA domain-containing protein n=1 Tax=Marasmius crinis-equi TaxID=585013 RepID=A0ABR3FAV0_9AGAR
MPMDNSSWRSQSTSPTSSPSPSPTLVDNLRLYGEDETKPSKELGTKEVFRDVVKGRKSWKTLKGGEMVWPPELEAALLEGLASYQPDDSRETRLLGRFPMRNRYISAYIYQKTGKSRTAKQVGSRLQQLRDTCGTKKLQHLLSPCRKGATSATSKNFQYNSLQRYGLSAESPSSSDNSAPNSPVSETSDPTWRQSLPSPVMYICLLPENSYDSRLSSEDSSSISSIGAETRPRSIHHIDPTLTFTSYSPLDPSARSLFEVYHSQKQLVHREECPLQSSQLSGADEEGRYLYSTSLIPGFWDAICNVTGRRSSLALSKQGTNPSSSDPTEYTIKHKVVKDIALNPSPLFSAVYKFRYPLDATSHRGRFTSSSTDFNMRTSHHSVLTHDFPFECPNAADDSFDVGSLSEVPYTSSEMGTIFDTSCYQNNSGSVSPRSEPSVGYVRRASDSLSPPPSWFFTHSSRPNYVGPIKPARLSAQRR